jgi:hypothetical protein
VHRRDTLTDTLLRAAALGLAALTVDAPRADRPARVTAAADAYLAWLDKPPPITHVILVAGTPADRNRPKGTPVSIVMPDNDEVTITVSALDAEGVAVADPFTDPAGLYLAPFTWAVDNTTLAGVTVSADTLSVVLASAAGQSGTVAVTATDANGKAVPAFTVEIDPSAAVSAGLVAGTPVPRPAA